MGRIRTSDDLLQIEEGYTNSQKHWKYQVPVRGGAGCISSRCQEAQGVSREPLKVNNLEDAIHATVTGRMGTCVARPVLLVEPGGIFYTSMTLEKATDMVARHLVGREVYREYTFHDSYKEMRIPELDDIDFFKRQVRITLRNCGRMKFTSMEAYIARDGCQSTNKAPLAMSQADVVEQIKASGLRGRDGAGFPTSAKQDAGMKTTSKNGIKYVICNVDKGDPGAFMDHSLLEGDPHNIIEGMMIGGYTIGASRGFVYARVRYPLAMKRLSSAIAQAGETGPPGSDILGTGFSFDLEVRIGAGVFVCGEEISLLSSTEGRRGGPRREPSSPFGNGLSDELTIINSVETLANIAPIILHGADWYRQFGTKKSTGTKVFALARDIKNPGIIEVPISILLGDVIYKIGGGIKNGKKFKTIQSGGPPDGCLTYEHLNTKVDYEPLIELDVIMGSGGLIVMNEDTCMVDAAWYFMDPIRDESCGKRLPCRNGIKRMLKILERIIKGRGEEDDLELLKELVETVKQTAMRGLGQAAPNPVLSMLKYFRREYEACTYDKRCKAGVCAELQEPSCRNACSAYVHVPGYISLLSVGRIDEAYRLIYQDDPFPSVCGRVCTHPCEDHCRRNQAGESISICSLKRFIGGYALRDDYTIPWIQPQSATGRKASIVGAGPSGLTYAYYLANLGHQVDVYNSEPAAGGALYWGIPGYRLPKEALAREVKAVEMAGVSIYLDTRIGDDISFEQLRTGPDAIYVTTETQESRLLDVPGEDSKGVESGLVFLKRIGLRRDMSVPKRPVVIDGGSTAVDTTRTTIRLGSEEVTIVYHRIEEEMPVGTEETAEARGESVNIITMTSPGRFLGKDGRVTAIHLVRGESTGYGRDGRQMSHHIEGSDFNLGCDGIVTAVNQDVDHLFYRTVNIDFDNRGRVGINQFAIATSKDGVLAGDDVNPWGRDMVITAVADDKRAASSIDRYLDGSGELSRGQTTEIPDVEGSEIIEPYKRSPVRTLSSEEQKDNFKEAACGFHRLDVMTEALRCLRCDRR